VFAVVLPNDLLKPGPPFMQGVVAALTEHPTLDAMSEAHRKRFDEPVISAPEEARGQNDQQREYPPAAPGLGIKFDGGLAADTHLGRRRGGNGFYRRRRLENDDGEWFAFGDWRLVALRWFVALRKSVRHEGLGREQVYPV
jgi:hypothetical protein